MKFRVRNYKWEVFRAATALAIACGSFFSTGPRWISLCWLLISADAALRALSTEVSIKSDSLAYYSFFKPGSFPLADISTIKVAPLDGIRGLTIELSSGKKFNLDPTDRETVINLVTKANPKVVVKRLQSIYLPSLPPPKPSTWLIRPTNPWNPIAWLSLVYDASTHTIHPISSSPNRPEVGVEDKIEAA